MRVWIVCVPVIVAFLISPRAMSDGTVQDDVPADVTLQFPIQPSDKYAFLCHPLDSEEEKAARASMPFARIELEVWGPPDLFHLKDGANAKIAFTSDGSATYEGRSGVERIGKYTGDLDVIDYGRICLLLERFDVTQPGRRFGRQIKSSHPVIHELSLYVPGVKEPRIYRNDANFGDYRFWVVQSIIEKLASDVEWKREDK